MSRVDKPVDRAVPLFDKTRNERGRKVLWERARINQAILEVLGRAGRPMGPYEVSKKVIEAGAYRRSVKPKGIYSHVCDALEGMERRSAVRLVGKAPSEGHGSNETYELTAYGRMLVSTLIVGRASAIDLEEQRRDILEFIEEYCKTNNPFVCFDFDVMERMLERGDLDFVIKFFRITVENFSVGSLRRPTPGWIRHLGEMWTAYLNFPEEPGYARAFLDVYRGLPQSRRKSVARYVKTRMERDWLLGIPPDQAYIQAVVRGGESVHLPRECPRCERVVVLAKSVDEMYSDIANGVRPRCRRCGSRLREPTWVPWYWEGTGKV